MAPKNTFFVSEIASKTIYLLRMWYSFQVVCLENIKAYIYSFSLFLFSSLYFLKTDGTLSNKTMSEIFNKPLAYQVENKVKNFAYFDTDFL